MVAFPPCKINLGLHVLNKRPDGYHNIETCFAPVPWTDILEIIPSDQFTFTSSGNIIPGDGRDNLCIMAYYLLKDDFSLPAVNIHLHKIIPTGAGLGGGSSDAAHTLLLLNEIFSLKLTTLQLERYAGMIGSDCPFFIHNMAMFGSGRGEVMEPVQDLDLNSMFLVLVKPDVHVSTQEAYAGIVPQVPVVSLRSVLGTYPVAEWKDVLVNDFEYSVSRKHPVIRSIKEKFYKEGAVYASMSGSGSSVFGIFSSPVNLKDQFPGCEYWQGSLMNK